MDPVEQMLKTLDQMRMINRDALLALRHLEATAVEDSQRGQKAFALGPAFQPQPQRQAPPAASPSAEAAPSPPPVATPAPAPPPPAPQQVIRPEPAFDVANASTQKVINALESMLENAADSLAGRGEQVPTPPAPPAPTPAPQKPIGDAFTGPQRPFGLDALGKPPEPAPAPTPASPAPTPAPQTPPPPASQARVIQEALAAIMPGVTDAIGREVDQINIAIPAFDQPEPETAHETTHAQEAEPRKVAEQIAEVLGTIDEALQPLADAAEELSKRVANPYALKPEPQPTQQQQTPAPTPTPVPVNAPVPLAPPQPIPLQPTQQPTQAAPSPAPVPLAPPPGHAPISVQPPIPLPQQPAPAPAPQSAGIFDMLKQSLAPLAAMAAKVTAALAGVAAAPAGARQSAGLDALASVSGTATKALSAIHPVVMLATEGFQQLTGKISGFVSALNPALMEHFGFVMRDLSATIGVALEPLMQAAIGVGREFGSILLPALQAIRPAVQGLATQLSRLVAPYAGFIAELIRAASPLIDLLAGIVTAFQPLQAAVYGLLTSVVKALVSVLQPVVQALSLFMQALSPVIGLLSMFIRINSSLIEVIGKVVGGLLSMMSVLNPLTWIMKGLAAVGELLSPVLEAISVVAAGLAEVITQNVSLFASWLAGLLGVDLSGVFNSVKGFMEKFATGLILVTAALARALGFTSIIDGMKKALQGPEKKDNTGIAAAQNAQVGSFSSLASAVTRAALLAGPGGTPKDPSSKWREDTLTELKKLSTGDDFVSKLMTRLQDWAADYLEKNIPKWIRSAKDAAFDTATSMATDSVRKNSGSLIGGMLGGIPGAVLGGFFNPK